MEPTYIKFQKFIKSTQYGYTADETSTESGDCKYLRITDIVPYFVDKDHVPYCKIAEGKKSQYIVSNGDLLIARTGATTGYNLVIDDSFNNFIFASYLIRFNLDKNKLYPLFVKYVLKSKSWYGFVNNYVGGSAQPGMNARVFGKFDFPYLPLPTQRRIASILSTYDALIQNYKRQIAALQSAASELYKEWFVRFRFPGYKNAKFDNGLPEGWKVASAKDIGEFVRGKNITADEMIKGNIPVISAGIEPSGYHNKANVNGVSLTISNSGANAGFLMINYSSIWAADCSYCNTAKSIYFYYEMLNNMRVALFNLQQGSAQPHVYAKDINKLKVLLPTKDLIAKADSAIKSFHNKIYLLQQQITNLTTQRDLLLPRLMSGKLSVE
ncbi:MAG: restriction endonuclease subunit S [Bacteroidales bacterium]|nr:restriction endonuclease subunit S [Bacteroidales bacterium]